MDGCISTHLPYLERNLAIYLLHVLILTSALVKDIGLAIFTKQTKETQVSFSPPHKEAHNSFFTNIYIAEGAILTWS